MKRIVLLVILAIEGASAIYGGSRLVIAPDGHLIKMSVEVMHGVFSNFFIPGVILMGMGLLSLIAFAAVLAKITFDWVFAGIVFAGFVIWFVTEIVILRVIHPLHFIMGVPVLLGFGLSLLLMRERRSLN